MAISCGWRLKSLAAASGLEVIDCAEKVNRRAAKPIDGPGQHHIELAPAGVLQQGVKTRALVAPLGAGRCLEHASADLGNGLDVADTGSRRFTCRC